MSATTSQPLLYNPRTGELNCTRHAPHPLTDARRDFRWVDDRDRAEAAATQLELRCEICRAEPRP